MTEISYEQITRLCINAGLKIANEAIGFGREITYTNDPLRTVVVHFVEADFPNTVRKTLDVILSIEKQWFLLKRHGPFSAATFDESEFSVLVDQLILSWPKIELEGDDLYLIGESGKVFLSYDHHVVDDGLGVYLTEIDKAGALLSRLNELGAEVELFSLKD